MMLVSEKEKHTRCNSTCLHLWHSECSTRVSRPIYLDLTLKGDRDRHSRTMITGPCIVWDRGVSTIELDSLSSCQKVKQLSFKPCLQLPPSLFLAFCPICYCALLLLERAVCLLLFFFSSMCVMNCDFYCH